MNGVRGVVGGGARARGRLFLTLGGVLAGGVLASCAVDGVTGPDAPGIQDLTETADLAPGALSDRIQVGDPLARILRFREELALSPDQVAELEAIRERFLESSRTAFEELRSAMPGPQAMRPAPLRDRIRREFPQAEARLRGMDPADRAEALERLQERLRINRRPERQGVDPERLEQMRERARARMEERLESRMELREMQRRRQEALAPLRQELLDAQARLRNEVWGVLTPDQLERLDALPDRVQLRPMRIRPPAPGR